MRPSSVTDQLAQSCSSPIRLRKNRSAVLGLDMSIKSNQMNQQNIIGRRRTRLIFSRYISHSADRGTVHRVAESRRVNAA